MKRNKFVAYGMFLTLALTTALSGCGRSPKSGTQSVKITNGKITDNSFVMKVGDKGVKYSEIRNYCYLLKCQYESSFGANLWKYKLDKKTTIGDEAKQEIVNMVTQLKVIKTTAENQKVTLTADEQDEAVQNAEHMFKSASDKDKEKYCLNVQGLTELYEDNIIANKMFYIATDAANTDVTDDEAKQITIQYLEVMTNGTNKDGMKINMDKPTKAAALKKAIQLCKEAKKTSDFEEFAQDNTDIKESEATIGKDSSDMERNVINAAFKLKKGGISNVVEGSSGYYIIYCADDNNEDATYKRKEQIIEERQTSMFKDKYSEWLKKCRVNISNSFWDEFKI